MDWIDKIKQNENKALKELYTLYRRDTISWLISSFHVNEEEAIDIFQTTVIIFYDQAIQNKVEKIKTDVKFYLRGIAKNKAMELFRQKTKDNNIAVAMLDSYIEEDGDINISEEQIIHAEEALHEIGNPCKDILVRYYYQGQSMDEITEDLGYKNADTTKNQKYKCLKRLQSIYFKHYSNITEIGD